MIKYIRYKNFKALRKTTLHLGQFTLLVGPNGSGKTTALQGLAGASEVMELRHSLVLSAGAPEGDRAEVELGLDDALSEACVTTIWMPRASKRKRNTPQGHPIPDDPLGRQINSLLHRVRIYSLNADAIAAPVTLKSHMELARDGAALAGVLDRLRDEHPERFEALNDELAKWLPEFDRVLFDTPSQGCRGILLRLREGGHAIKASELSQGTLLALAILTIAYLPAPPPVVGLEEPDRGIHPRLLRDVRDAMYRLAYPESFGESRDPVQVIATTHSPYMLDQFRDHPEEIVIAQKVEDNVRFDRLSERKDLDEILHDAHLGEVWYSGILGGVPTEL